MNNYNNNCITSVSISADHNKTHAADVLHAVSYLLFEMIPEFSHEFSYAEEQREWKVGEGAREGVEGGDGREHAGEGGDGREEGGREDWREEGGRE